MKSTLAKFTVALLIGLFATAAPAFAQTLDKSGKETKGPKVHIFDGSLADGTSIQVVSVPENGKVGIITRNAKGEPVSAYMFYKVADASERFYRTAATTFGKVDQAFVYFEISALEGDSITFKVDGGESQTLAGREPIASMAEGPFGGCRNYCYPSDPNNYNWYLCFWCCATTGNNPC